jgi:hypothetical protein
MTARALLPALFVALIGCAGGESSDEKAGSERDSEPSAPARDVAPGASVELGGRTCDAVVTVRSSLQRGEGDPHFREGTLGASIRFVSETHVQIDTNAPLAPANDLHALATLSPRTTTPPARLTWVVDLVRDGGGTLAGSTEKGSASANLVIGKEDVTLTFTGAMPVDTASERATLRVEGASKVPVASCR